jgi:hypothetical protein
VALRRPGWKTTAVATVCVAAAVGVLRQGVIPGRFLPIPAIDLTVKRPWFVDWRLAELRRDPGLCRRVLKEPIIASVGVTDTPMKDGCGITNGVRITRIGGARVDVGRLTCEMAAATALWLTHEVQPAAQKHFGASVASVQHLGTYSCRNIAGSKWLGAWRSEHATANAIDISGFTLTNGKSITLIRDWKGSGSESAFLREIHSAACRYFRVAIGPEFNAAHRDHFHYDRGAIDRCL